MLQGLHGQPKLPFQAVHLSESWDLLLGCHQGGLLDVQGRG